MTTAYQVVTDNILAMLDEGVVPWLQPWRNIGGRPMNVRNTAYRGINVFILMAQKARKGYTSNFWMTYKQAVEMGGNVKKGEKATTITFWKVGKPIKEWDEEKQRTVTRRPFMLRFYYVFSLDQTENVKLTKAMQAERDRIDAGLVTNPTLDDAEAIVSSYFVRDDAPSLYEQAQDDCYYIPSEDAIYAPLRGQFLAPEGFYYALFHEMGHSTGHARRLHRKGIGDFSHGKDSYAREELVAEMTNAFLCNEAQLDADLTKQSASYIKGWADKIRADNTLIVQAASSAQKAADYIMGIEYKNEDEDD